MQVAILSCGAIVVREKENSWLFGAPEGIREALDAAGIEVPPVVFTTSLRSPGYGRLGAVMRFKEMPLTMNGLSARPLQRKHGTDYQIDAGHAKILFSERGDVSTEDTEGYHLAIIRNKHRADAFGNHVITWPWKDAEYLIQDNIITPITEVQLKVWSSMEDVPANLKKLNGAILSLEQANYIARVAVGAGSEDDEKWGIAIAQFKKAYQKEGDHWVERKEEKEKDMMGMMDGKLSQDLANYDPKGGENVKACANCEYYLHNFTCKKVDGEIKPEGVCSLWEYHHDVNGDIPMENKPDYPPPMYSENTYAYMGEVDESFKETLTNSEGRTAADHLVVGDTKKVSTWALPIGKGGEPDIRLMGAASAALTVGYRGNKYEGEGKSEAVRKLLSLYKKLDKEPPENLQESTKEFDVIERIKDEGGKEDEIISIAVDKETGNKYYFNFGDWAEKSTIEAARKVVGETNFDAEAEAPPDETKYKIVWQYGKRKEYAGDRPIPRIIDIMTAALHKAYNDTSDKLFSVGYLSQDERMKIAASIGEGLKAFRNAIQTDEFAERPVDKWDADQLMTINKSITHVYKASDNKWRWMAITSVATWDKQGELLTTKAMDWAIGFAKMSGYRGPLRYKHIPGLDGGDCDTQWRFGDYLFESGTFRDNPVGLAMRTMLKESPSVWQISPGLAFAKNDLVNGVYKRAAIFERSMTQRPANPYTIVVHKENYGEMEMKILTEQELKQAADELNKVLPEPMEFEEIKTMYERALASGAGPLGLKEFTETVIKATGTNASGFPGGANSSHKNRQEEEGETEMLKQAVEELDEEELKHLAELVESSYKEKGKLPPWLKKDGKDEDKEDEEEMMDEEEMPMKGKMKKKGKSSDTGDGRIDRLENLVTQQGELLVQQTKAMGELAKALAGGGSQQKVEDAVAQMFSQMPRKQAAGFVSQRNKAQAYELPDDNEVTERLKSIEAMLAAQQHAQSRGVYDMFTSKRLNQGKGAR